MNQFRSWLYGHDISVSNVKNQSLNSSRETNKEEHSQEKSKQLGNIGRIQAEGPESSVRLLLLRVVPLAPGDCLGCKLVGTGVMMISGLLVALSAAAARKNAAEKRNPKLVGVNGVVYNLLCGSLFLGFEISAFCRLFDKGPFAKPETQIVETKP